MEKLAWYEDDEKAERLIRLGHTWQLKVIERLRSRGIDARQAGVYGFREHISQRAEYKDDRDVLIVIPGWDHPLWVEVKSWGYAFGDDPTSYPTETKGFPSHAVHFETVKRRETRGYDPVAWVLVSRKTNGVLAIPANESSDFFTSGEVHDIDRDININWWCCWRHKLRSFSWLCQSLGGGDGNI